MSLRAARLPIVRPCPDLDALERTGAAQSWCRGCAKVVHDFSAMTEAEVRRLLARSVGTSICVEYGVQADGTIRLQPARRRGWAAACGGALLSACAGHLDEDPLAAPSDCADEDGCDESVARWWYTPDEQHGDPATDHADGDHRHSEAPPPSPTPDGSAPQTPDVERVGFDADPDQESGASRKPAITRVDFSVDPSDEMHRGCLAVRDDWHDADGKLRFVPTRELFDDLRDRIRARRR